MSEKLSNFVELHTNYRNPRFFVMPVVSSIESRLGEYKTEYKTEREIGQIALQMFVSVCRGKITKYYHGGYREQLLYVMDCREEELLEYIKRNEIDLSDFDNSSVDGFLDYLSQFAPNR